MKASARAGTVRLGLALCALAALLALPSAASADLSFCPQGFGAGQCAPPASGNFNSVRSLAVDNETNRLYVADEANNRIDVFKDDGSFLFAFGFGVADGTTNAPQTCTTTCFKGIAGTGSGQLTAPRAIAVDNDPASPSFHDVYVAEPGESREHPRVQKFEPTGAFVWTAGKGVDKTDNGDLCTKAEAHTCGAGAASEAEGGFGKEGIVLGVGPAGVLYTIDNERHPGDVITQRLQRFQPSGAPISPQAILFEGHLKSARALAVDSSGNAWVSSQEEGLRKYSPAGALLAGPIDAGSSFALGSLSFNAAGTLYAGQNEVRDKAGGRFNVISTYDSSGNALRRFAYSGFGSRGESFLNGLAAHASASGDVFFSKFDGGITYVSEPPPGPVTAPPSVEAKSVGNARATLYAEANPEGKASEAHFEYVSQKGYEEQGSSFTGPKTKSSEPVPLGAAGFSLKASEALAGCPEATKALIEAGKCLTPETKYRFRVVAENADGKGNSPVEGAPFTTKAPLEFGDTYATAVGTDAATLHAELNPLGIPTEAHFEYVDDAHFQESGFDEATELPNVGEGAAPLDYGSGEAITARAATAYPLAAGTTYHYRLVATDPLLEAPLIGPARTFTTPRPAQGQSCPANEASRIGPGAFLPDCRAYEMVSPVDKAGGDILVLQTSQGVPAVLEQSSLSGERLAYGSLRSFGDAASAPYTSQYIAQRVAGAEWQTHSIDSPRGRPVVVVLAQTDTEFKFFSPDLCDAWQVTYAEPPLAEGALAGYESLYRRGDRLCGPEGYQALAPIEAPVGVPAGNAIFIPELQGVSADGAEAIFLANGRLGSQGSEKGDIQLYVSAATAPPRLVCVLPDAVALSGSCTAGSTVQGGALGLLPASGADPGGAVSRDGGRVFWLASSGGEGKLYVRENPEAPESARTHGAASGTGTVIGPAAGTGNVVVSATEGEIVKNVHVESGGFAPGQTISDSNGGIPPNTTIKAIEETATGVFKLTLSAKATKTKLGDSLAGAASEKVPGIVTETGAFQAGQEISAGNEGIPPGTTVLSCSPSCGPAATSLTLSAKATKTKVGAALEATSPCTEAATKACTVWISKAAEEAAGTSKSWFWGSADDGSKAIFSTGQLPSFGGGGSIGQAQATLSSFEPGGEVTTPIAAGVGGVMGMSDNADRVYFASKEVLSGEEENGNGDKAQEGKPNLYLYEAGEGGGTTKFIATLANNDLTAAVSNERFGKRSSRVTPDGLHAAFISAAPLSGYDNKAAGNGEATNEVYRYDATTNELLCVSCNPSGARPAGRSSIPFFATSMHAARVLSDDGSRLYFESADALSPRDSNGAVDVYQWEEPGAGSCAQGNPDYSPQDGGCIDLISSGQSPVDSRFVEADPSGKNVFFATLSGLLPQDPGLTDVYDARVNGGLPVPPPEAPLCEGEACQSPPGAPNDPTPGSASFQGAGNVHEEAPATAPRCAKGKVARKGRCVARKSKRSHKRAAKHNRRAER